MKSEIIAGDTLDFTTSVSDYPPSDGYTLSYRLIPRTSGTAIEFDATEDDGDYRVEVGPSTTADWAAGEYSWVCYVSKAGVRYTVDSGLVTILPDPAVIAAYDSRSHARVTLDAIEAIIENRATLDQQEYSIAGRSLKRMTVEELLMFRDRYRAQVYAETQAENVRNGKSAGKVTVRL